MAGTAQRYPRRGLAAALLLLAQCAPKTAGELGGNSGPSAPAISWHGLPDPLIDGEIRQITAPIVIRLDGIDRILKQCGPYSSSAVSRLTSDSNGVLIAGCFTLCVGLTSSTCAWNPGGAVPVHTRGVSLLSRDAGLTWKPLSLDVDALRYAGAAMATVDRTPAGSLAPMVCRVGGLYSTAPGVFGSSTSSVSCTLDGVHWYAQAAMPEPRVELTVTAFQVPDEVRPRLFVYSGIASRDAMGRIEPVNMTMIASAPLDLSEGALETGQAVTGWAEVTALPQALRQRRSAVVAVWPGLSNGGDGAASPFSDTDPLPVTRRLDGQDSQDRQAADEAPSPQQLELGGRRLTVDDGMGWVINRQFMLGYGVSTDISDVDEEPVNGWINDWWRTTNPLDNTTYARMDVTASSLDPPMNSGFMSTVPVGVLVGDMTSSSLGSVPPGRPIMVAFTDTGGAFAWAGASTQWSSIRFTFASSLDPSLSSDHMYSNAGRMTSYTTLLDGEGRPMIIALVGDQIMRGFTKRCDYTCPAGYYARHCGVDYHSPICERCSTCTGFIATAGYARPTMTYQTSQCHTGFWLHQNADTVCKTCSLCAEGNTTVNACTTLTNTVCGPVRGRPVYLPTSNSFTIAHGSLVSGVPVAAVAMVAAVVLAGAWLQYGSWCLGLVTRGAKHGWEAEPGHGKTPVIGGAPGMAKEDVPGLPALAAGVTNPNPEMLAYLKARQESINREKRTELALWSASSVLAVADVTLAFLSYGSFTAFGMSLVWGDARSEAEIPAWVHDGFKPFGRWLLAILGIHAILVAGRGAWILISHRLHLETIHVTMWLQRKVNQLMLSLVLLVVPLHSRLVSLLVPGSPLGFPLPVRVHTALAIMSSMSIFILDIPALAIIISALWTSGIPVGDWHRPDKLSAVPYFALVFAETNLVASVARAAWDVATCVRSGGLYRLRRALAGMPAWRWLVSLLLPRKAAARDAEADAVPRLVGHGKRLGTAPSFSKGQTAADMPEASLDSLSLLKRMTGVEGPGLNTTRSSVTDADSTTIAHTVTPQAMTPSMHTPMARTPCGTEHNTPSATPMHGNRRSSMEDIDSPRLPRPVADPFGGHNAFGGSAAGHHVSLPVPSPTYASSVASSHTVGAALARPGAGMALPATSPHAYHGPDSSFTCSSGHVVQWRPGGAGLPVGYTAQGEHTATGAIAQSDASSVASVLATRRARAAGRPESVASGTARSAVSSTLTRSAMDRDAAVESLVQSVSPLVAYAAAARAVQRQAQGSPSNGGGAGRPGVQRPSAPPSATSSASQ